MQKEALLNRISKEMEEYTYKVFYYQWGNEIYEVNEDMCTYIIHTSVYNARMHHMHTHTF